jgi:hypothetical protein
MPRVGHQRGSDEPSWSRSQFDSAPLLVSLTPDRPAEDVHTVGPADTRGAASHHDRNHSQPEGIVTASAAELGRRWGWNRMRTGRRLKAWEKAGLIRRNAEAIVATASVTSTVTDVTPTVAEAVSVTLIP